MPISRLKKDYPGTETIKLITPFIILEPQKPEVYVLYVQVVRKRHS